VSAAVGGAIAGRADPSFILLQVPDGVGRGFDRIMVYGPDLAAASVISGVIYASGGFWCGGSDTTAYNGRDHSARNDVAVYLRTDIGGGAGTSTLLEGASIRYPIDTYALVPASLPGIAPAKALAPALLAHAVGSWALIDRRGTDMALDVAANGAFTLRYRGCTLNGALRVADGGLYAATARHDQASCTGFWAHDLPYEGVVLAYPLASGAWQMVVALSTNNGVDFDELLAIGRR
jgi:hypothetical protein